MRTTLHRVSRNLILMYAIRICTVSSALIVPNLVMFVRGYGVSQDQFYWLESAFAVALLLAQLPTGRIADKIGRKRSMQIGSLILPVSQIMYAQGTCLQDFIFAEVLGAFGIAFLSGADEAIFYESLILLKRRHLHSKLWGTAFLCGFLAMSLGNFIGGLLSIDYPRAPFYCAALGFLLLTFLTLFLEEPNRKIGFEEPERVPLCRVISLCLFERSDIRWLICFPAVFMISMQTSLWLYQGYFLSCGIDARWHGLMIAAMNLSAGGMSRFASITERKLRAVWKVATPWLVMSCGFFALPFLHSWWAVPVLLVQSSVRGYLPTVFSGYLNHALPPHSRATALSLKGACELLYYLLLLQVTRVVVHHGGITAAFVLHGVLTTVLGAMLLRKRGRLF